MFAEGHQSSFLCLVAEGSISIFKHISDAEQLQVAEIEAEGSIGEMRILDDQPISATAIASINTIVFLISRTEFKRLIFKNKEIGVKFLWKIGRIISVRLRKKLDCSQIFLYQIRILAKKANKLGTVYLINILELN